MDKEIITDQVLKCAHKCRWEGTLRYNGVQYMVFADWAWHQEYDHSDPQIELHMLFVFDDFFLVNPDKEFEELICERIKEEETEENE